jgi:hypothetical protein
VSQQTGALRGAMATLDGLDVVTGNVAVRVDAIGERGRGAKQSLVLRADGPATDRLWMAAQERRQLEYVGPILFKGEHFNGRVLVCIDLPVTVPNRPLTVSLAAIDGASIVRMP